MPNCVHKVKFYYTLDCASLVLEHAEILRTVDLSIIKKNKHGCELCCCPYVEKEAII